MDDALSLHVLAKNYNWDDGFDIPNCIVNNEKCELGTALLLFYNADGYRMLESEQEFTSSNSTEWKQFLTTLYSKITNGHFTKKNIAFHPPLTKVQLFKLKKSGAIPPVFLDPLE